MSDLGTFRTLIRNSMAAVKNKGVSVIGAELQTLPAKIAEIPTGSPSLPDLVAGGTYRKQDGTPVTISAISGETSAIRLLVAATGPMKTALVLNFTGTVTIDWGDGTTTTPTSGVAAVHQYDGVNPIPCNRPYGVYYITITGGSVTVIASSTNTADWGGIVGNIVAYALKSTTLTTCSSLGASTSVFQYMVEDVYVRAPLTTLGFLLLYGYSVRRFAAVATGASAVTLINYASAAGCLAPTFDFSESKILGDVTLQRICANATSILFNPTNTEIGNINIQYNSLSVAGFVALFNSLPTVTAKTLQIGGSVAALALTAEQIAIATAKGWTVTRSY